MSCDATGSPDCSPDLCEDEDGEGETEPLFRLRDRNVSFRRVLVGVTLSGVLGSGSACVCDGPGARCTSVECFELDPRMNSDKSEVFERKRPGVGMVDGLKVEEGRVTGRTKEGSFAEARNGERA